MKKSISISLTLLFLTFITPLIRSQQLTDTLRLKNYKPVSIFNIPETVVEKGKFPVIDVHSHDYALNEEEINAWVENMNACGIEKTHLLSCNWIGKPFEEFVKKYAAHAGRFAFWTSIY